MELIIDIFRSPWLTTLGYTLINSLWQGAIVFAIVAGLLKLIPLPSSKVRYAIAIAGLALIVAGSVATFYILYDKSAAVVGSPRTSDLGNVAYYQITTHDITKYLYFGRTLISNLLPLFMVVWACGAIFFNVRLVAGLAYIEKIRRESSAVTRHWSDLLNRVCSQLDITREIQLAESAAVHAPIIIGFLRPIILIPVGMLSGLSVAQVETILIHELMHVRRNDYIINILQTFIEAIYFFNPFVWMVSRIIKTEREHCCDDAVIAIHGNAKDYVIALAALEHARLSRVPVSLAFAENKNQLLNRIKRIMEKSVKDHSGREKIIPALLLVLGLICASWISIRTSSHEDHSGKAVSTMIPQDTTKKKNKSGKTKTKEPRAAQNEAAAADPQEPATPVKPHREPNPSVAEIPSLPPLPDFDFNFHFDTTMRPFGWQHEKGWEEFGEAFEKNFKAKFEDFYIRNQDEIEKLMKETEKNLKENFGPDWQVQMEELAGKHEQWAREHADVLARRAEDFAIEHDGLIRKNLEKLEHVDVPQEFFGENHQEFEQRMQALEENLKALEKAHKLFDEQMKSELIKDGYLKDGEELENMHWRNGLIEVNGKRIKPEHEKKYNELHQKYLAVPKPVE